MCIRDRTIGKKKYALVEDEIKELAERMKGIQGQFSALADQDAKVFAPLAKCYSLPSGTEEEKAYKAEVMEARLLDASLVPMEIMEKAWEMPVSYTHLSVMRDSALIIRPTQTDRY